MAVNSFSKRSFFIFCFLIASCSSDKKIDKVIEYAKTYQNVPYKYGGENRYGIDCSALMQKSFASQGIELPRRAVWQSSLGTYVDINNLRKGNLIFFKKSSDEEISHVGLVISGQGRNAKFIHASGRLNKVAISRISDDHWSNIFVFGKEFSY